VTRGRGIPRERLRQVGEHYFLFRGVSPINAVCRELVVRLQAELDARGTQLPVYWGNRNWHPMLEHTVRRMAEDGVRRAVAVATSAYSSYSACRQYLEDIERARATVGPAAPLIEKLAPFWSHPSFIETMVAHTQHAIGELPTPPARMRSRLLFTAHSIPTEMAATCDYEAELREASSLVAMRACPELEFELVYQSRSGAPSQPWLEPDICERLRALAAAGVSSVVVVPIGFVADHMEVLYDLDTQARAVAAEAGIEMVRAKTAGTAPTFVAGLAELISDHIAQRAPRSLARRGPRPFPCLPGCCSYTPAARRSN
jgi:ferrochelatase